MASTGPKSILAERICRACNLPLHAALWGKSSVERNHCMPKRTGYQQNKHTKVKKKKWMRHHRYFGLVLAFFLLMFCVSGIVLNHPALFAQMDVGRNLLPQKYHYDKWNNGLMRGTVKWQDKVLLYGNAGIWLTDSTAKAFMDFNRGLPEGVDNRNIRGMAIMPKGEVFAAAQYGLYRLDVRNTWQAVPLPLQHGDRLADIATRGDTLVVTTRSQVFVARAPYRNFSQLQLASPVDGAPRFSLFRIVWWLHSGELFGLLGKLIVDAVALVLIFLCLSGVVYWLLPHVGKHAHTAARRWLFSWHDRVGRVTIVLTLLVCATGWMLRPPLLLLIASAKVPALPFTTASNDNPWYDKLRSLRWDERMHDWLLYTSDGFYSLSSLSATPSKIAVQPPVSVMGLNVQKTVDGDYWLLGSFSGLYIWQRSTGMVIDYFTEKPARVVQGPPVGANAIAGFSNDFGPDECVVNYAEGCNSIAMPQWMATLPMSLRNVALEIHTGRMYTFLGPTSVLYIFIVGAAVLWCLWTGWKIRVRVKKNKAKRNEET